MLNILKAGIIAVNLVAVNSVINAAPRYCPPALVKYAAFCYRINHRLVAIRGGLQISWVMFPLCYHCCGVKALVIQSGRWRISEGAINGNNCRTRSKTNGHTAIVDAFAQLIS